MTVKFRHREPVEHPLMKTIVLGRNPDWGAPQIIISGRVGSGKTSLLTDLAYRVLKRRGKGGRPKNEYVFWKGQESCQWKRLADNGVEVKIIAPAGVDVKFYTQRGKELKDYVIHRYESLEEFWDLAELGKLNVIYVDWKQLTDFMRWIQIHKFDWSDFFVDEVESWAPEGASGKQWKLNKEVSNVVAEARKSYMAVYGATQAEQSISWIVRKKLMGHIFLMGATYVGMTPLYQQAIHALRLGNGWVTIGGEYEKFAFNTYLAKGLVRARVKYDKLSKEGRMPFERDKKGRVLGVDQRGRQIDENYQPIEKEDGWNKLIEPIKDKKKDIHDEGVPLSELIAEPNLGDEEAEEGIDDSVNGKVNDSEPQEDDGEREWKRAEARSIAAEMNAERESDVAEFLAGEGTPLKRNEANDDEEAEE